MTTDRTNEPSTQEIRKILKTIREDYSNTDYSSNAGRYDLSAYWIIEVVNAPQQKAIAFPLDVFEPG